MIENKINQHKFNFSKENLKKIDKEIAKYPKGKQASAIIALLFLAQKQNTSLNYVTREAMIEIGRILELPLIRVVEVAHFYTMINTKPVGKYHLQLCATTPCWLCGSDKIKDVITSELGIRVGETSKDQLFTLSEVECLGACSEAPILQINDDYYPNITPKDLTKLIKKLKKETITVKEE